MSSTRLRCRAACREACHFLPPNQDATLSVAVVGLVSRDIVPTAAGLVVLARAQVIQGNTMMDKDHEASSRAVIDGEIGILARRKIEAGIIAPIYRSRDDSDRPADRTAAPSARGAARACKSLTYKGF